VERLRAHVDVEEIEQALVALERAAREVALETSTMR
jgi:hypothetical protein